LFFEFSLFGALVYTASVPDICADLYGKRIIIVFRKLAVIVPALFFSAVIGLQLPVQAQSSDQKKYEPTLASLDSHPLPSWYDDAKLGIFIHWGLY
jgi:hypothetical protein